MDVKWMSRSSFQGAAVPLPNPRRAAAIRSQLLTASAMQGYEAELEKAIVLTLFIPLIMSSGGNSGSQATSLLIRALALRQLEIKDWWRVALGQGSV